MNNYLKLIQDISEVPGPESILRYLDCAKELMYEDQSVVLEVTQELKNFIFNWSKNKCNLDFSKIVEKKDLENKKDWYVEELLCLSQNAKTSGSTTGVPFDYLRFSPIFEKIEWDFHYNFILDEFGVGQNPNILYMMPFNYRKKGNDYVSCYQSPSHLNIVNHGNRRQPIIHYVNFDLYKNDRDNFFLNLFEYLEKNSIDVFYASAPEINSMCSYIRKFEIKKRLGFLLSNTNEKLLSQDASFILEGNFFDHICDHMRCWDGGASFFTCKHRTYHLMDEISWVESFEGKMISTDYFNLASPFVNYWNGDYCIINNNYKRCDCGRLYREFQFLENRPFSLKGTCIAEIKEKMNNLRISGIKQVRCTPEYLEVITQRDLSEEEKAQVCNISNKFKFKFSVEF